MYSFAQREDTSVVDEPMYANYLSRTGIEHPGRQEIIDSMPADLERVKSESIFNHCDTPLYFIKNMSQHFYDIDESFILDLENVIYIRNPQQIIASFAKVIEHPNGRDVGIQKQHDLYHYLIKAKREPIVLDSGELLSNPQKVLNTLCDRLGISFSNKMLSWKPGPRKEDGVWAKYWYGNVHKSTGFAPQKTSNQPLPEELMPLYEETIGYYTELYNLAIKA